MNDKKPHIDHFDNSKSTTAKEVLWLVSINVLCFILFMNIDILEALYAFSRRHEKYEIDEIFTVCITLTITLSIFSFRRWHEIRKLSNVVNELATRDALTQLFNRRAIEQLIIQESQRIQREQPAYSLLMLDIDHFKQVNDRYGHKKGDYVLQQLANLLTLHTRNIDAVGRWGGEEFMVLLPDTDSNHALQTAERLRQLVAKHPFGLDEPTTISLGIATSQNDEPYHTLFQRLDKALYQAKNTGRNRTVISPIPSIPPVVDNSYDLAAIRSKKKSH